MSNFRQKITLPGIPDDMFIRGDVPMTKSEIRALTMAKARISDGAVIYDIGAGTGSLSIEAALLAPNGKVYAIEKEEDAVALIKENRAKFSVSNLIVIHGTAPEALEDLPPADVVLVGGSGKNLKDIIQIVHAKLKEGGTVVFNSITLETLAITFEMLSRVLNYQTEVINVHIDRLIPMGSKHGFKSLNPIYIISAHKEAQEIG